MHKTRRFNNAADDHRMLKDPHFEVQIRQAQKVLPVRAQILHDISQVLGSLFVLSGT